MPDELNFFISTKETEMDNQHQKITGYRDLSQQEIDAMNSIKALAIQCGELVDGLRQPPPDTDPANKPDGRWVSIGATHLQEGFMALVRSVAKPKTF